MEAAIAAAVMLAVAGVAVAHVLVTPLLLAAAAGAVLLGRRVVAGHYLEDQLLTDRHALVVPRVGPAYGLALGDDRERRDEGDEGDLHGRRPRVPLLVRAPPPGAPARARGGCAARLARAALGSQLRRVRPALVTAPCARIAIVALTAVCALPAAATAADLRPCGEAPLRLGHGARWSRPTPPPGRSRVGFEVYAQRKGAKARDTILVSAGSDGVPTTANRAARAGAARAAARAPRHRARRCARHGPLGTRGRPRATPTARARRPATSTPCARARRRPHRALRAPATARASRSPTPRATATACARSCSTAGPRATLFAGDGRAEARGLAKALGSGEADRRAAGRAPAHAPAARRTAGSTTTCSRARRVRRRTRARSPSCRPRRPPRSQGDGVPLARTRRPRPRRRPARQAAQARASNCHDDAPPVAERRRSTAGRSPARPGCARWASPRARAGRSPRRPIPCCRPGAALGGAPALVLAGELGVDAPSATLRKVAGLLPSGTYVRVRGAGALPALSDPDGCAGTLARAFLETRGKAEPRLREPPRATARRDRVPGEPRRRRPPRCATPRRAAATARRSPTGARPPSPRWASPTRSPTPRRGGAPDGREGPARRHRRSVTRRGTGLTLALRGLRFVRDAALDGLVTHDTQDRQRLRRASRCARPTARAARSCSPGTRTRSKGYAAARGSADGRPLLLVLRAP